MKHLLKMLDLSTEEIIEILDLADQLKYELKHGIPHPPLNGTLAAAVVCTVCTSWAVIRCSCLQTICRSAEASRYRIPHVYCPGIWTAS